MLIIFIRFFCYTMYVCASSYSRGTLWFCTIYITQQTHFIGIEFYVFFDTWKFCTERSRNVDALALATLPVRRALRYQNK